MLDLFPEGFEEVEHGDGVELVAYTDAGGEERIWRAFGTAASGADVADGWEDGWRDFHRPVQVAGLWIGPPWQPAPIDVPAVVIDPGRAFGTGAHATTRLQLLLVAELDRGSFLDLGCGSGVLAIAAAKLGFAPVVALDVDDTAVEATKRNAAANGAAVEVRHADALLAPLPVADVTVANITRDVVESIARRLRSPHYVASGYLMTEPPAVAGYRHLKRVTDGGWAADLFERQ